MGKSKNIWHSRKRKQHLKKSIRKIDKKGKSDKSEDIKKKKVVAKNNMKDTIDEIDEINVDNVSQIQDKHKINLGSKEPIVLLSDCLLSDSEFVECVPLQCRIACNQFEQEYVKTVKSRNLRKDKTKVTNLIKNNVITHVEHKGNENGSFNHQIATCTKIKWTGYDQNSNIINLANDSDTSHKNVFRRHLEDKHNLTHYLNKNNNESILCNQQLPQSIISSENMSKNELPTLDIDENCVSKLVPNLKNEESKVFLDYIKEPKLVIVHSQESKSITYPKFSTIVNHSSEKVYTLKHVSTDTPQDINCQFPKRIKLNRNNFLIHSETRCKSVNASDVNKTVSLQLNVQEVLSETAILDIDESSTVRRASNNEIAQCVDTKLDDVSMRMFSDKINGTNAEIENTDDDSDCISLCANSSLLNEDDDYSNEDKPFQMTSTVIENYCSNIRTDFNKMYTDINNNRKSDNSTVLLEPSTSKQFVKQTGVVSREVSLFKNVFRGYCYKIIRTGGYCNSWQCRYNHNFLSRLLHLYYNEEQYFFRVITELAVKNYKKFLTHVYYLLLETIYDNININCALQMFKKLYELKIITEKEGLFIVKCVKEAGLTIKQISDQLAVFTHSRDTDFIKWIYKILKMYIEEGEVWDTLKSLLVKVNTLDTEIIETILQECVITQKYFQDVNNIIMNNLNSTDRLKINAELLLSFKNLFKCGDENQIEEYKASSNCSDGISLEYSPMLSERDNSLKRNVTDDNNGVYTEEFNFTLYPIDDLPKPYSPYGRIRFWKLYVDIYRLHEGLKHNDYDYVLNVLQTIKNNQQSIFSRVCYKILLNELRCSPYRSLKLIADLGNA